VRHGCSGRRVFDTGITAAAAKRSARGFTPPSKTISLSAIRTNLQPSDGRKIMKSIVFAAVLSLVAGSALADSCKVDAANKKLAGAAKDSFMKKCETDAKASCDKSAAEKKLAGAAKDSFTKKCVSDAVGS
jgi:hypothetical protein